MKFEVDIFHVGPQKTATTWVYRCFQEHPEIITSHSDSIHYYSMFYHRGRKWYKNQFETEGKVGKYFDPTPDYFRSPTAAVRLAKDNPNARLIICLRNPIERAFSHYWHEKKKYRYNYKFEEVICNFDLFTNWVEPGLYSTHIERFQNYFPQQQIKFVLFEDLELSPLNFIQDLYEFSGVDSNYSPSLLSEKINVAHAASLLPGTQRIMKLAKSSINKMGNEKFERLKGGLKKVRGKISMKQIETLSTIDEAILLELENMFSSEVDKLERLLDRDLSGWRGKEY